MRIMWCAGLAARLHTQLTLRATSSLMHDGHRVAATCPHAASVRVRLDEATRVIEAAEKRWAGEHDLTQGAKPPGLQAQTSPLSFLDADGRQLLTRLREHRQADIAWELYLRLQRHGGLGGALTSTDYCEFLGVLATAHWKRMPKYIQIVEDDMRKSGLFDESDATQAAAIISARAAAGDFAGASAAFETVRDAATLRGEGIDAAVVLAFLEACSHAREPEVALELHREHFADKLAPPAAGHQRPEAAAHVLYSRARLSLGHVLHALAGRGDLTCATSFLPYYPLRLPMAPRRYLDLRYQLCPARADLRCHVVGRAISQLIDEAAVGGTELLPAYVDALMAACIQTEQFKEVCCSQNMHALE